MAEPPGPSSIRRRLMAAQMAAAEAAMLRGAAPEGIDEAARAAGWPMGPCEADDLIGLHHAFEARREEGAAPFPVADRMVREGRIGKIGGVGWHRYPGGGGAVADPLIEDLIAEEAHFAGIQPKTQCDEAITRRLALALLAAGEALIADGATWASVDLAAAPPFPAPAPSIRLVAMAEGRDGTAVWIARLTDEDAKTPAAPFWRALAPLLSDAGPR